MWNTLFSLSFLDPLLLKVSMLNCSQFAVPSSCSEECTTVIYWWCSSGILSTLRIVWRTLGIILRLIQFTTTHNYYLAQHTFSQLSIEKKACKGPGKWVCHWVPSSSSLLWSHQCSQIEMAVWQEIKREILNIYYQDWHIVHDSFYTTFIWITN